MIGTATRLWFRQLRRLQSLKHAVHASKQTVAACVYRAEVWAAIRKAPGFMPDFPTWWAQQDHEVQGVPAILPYAVPTESVLVTAMFDSFLLLFRNFEAWHLKERSHSLKMKYAGSLEAIYMDLRSDPKPSVNHIWKENVYTILVVDHQGHQMQVDRHVQTNFDSVWYHDQKQLAITDISGDICSVSSSEHLAPGDELVQRYFLTDTNDVLRAFTEHWRTRWNAVADIPQHDWQRIVAFVSHYMPPFRMEWSDITVHMWRSIVKKFKHTAARGPDGFSKDDLINMPDGHVTALLDMLHAIETTDAPWPEQLAFGTVIGLGKHDQAHEESHFRPITLFSTIYRAWAKLRTRQMIRQLAELMPPEALGFLPSRETTEIWLLLQAQIEIALQYGMDLAGLSTDLKRAFNNIGRKQVLMTAKHVGFPQQLLRPWTKFLHQVIRRFDVQGCIGDELESTSGFPEGCPLSILAMLNVNWCYHVYMKAFCPKVTAYSFVDNLTLAAREAFTVAQAYFALRSICLLFGLHTDDDKTYVWALTRRSREQISQLGFPCCSDASELGGSMTFGRSRRTRILKNRGRQLQSRWVKLQRSQAPGPQKLSVLAKFFWPQALHGSSNVVIADSYAHDLRKEAVKALRLNGAGSNPMLRLSLSDDMQSDPGFYQTALCFNTFRRMLHKSPDLLQMWNFWRNHFDGQLLPGPFSRLMQCMSTIGWSMDTPPYVWDHEGHRRNLMQLDNKTLRFLLEDAWLQFVASQVRHKTMQGLNGMDGFLTKLDAIQLSALDRARLSALHSGAFMSHNEQSKFDVEKTPMCAICQEEDDRKHWLQCPRYQHIKNNIVDWREDNLELPHCTLYHLLVPRLQCLVHWRHLLSALEEDGTFFLVSPPKQGYHHLFLDGSCCNHRHPSLNLAAWGVVNATLGQPVAAAPLAGITQTIDRAELMSLVAGLQWADGTELGLCFWSDSQSTVHMAEYIWQFDVVPAHAENQDLWTQVQMLLRDRAGLPTDFRWIPSHLPWDAGVDPFEDWIIHWNDSVDKLAGFVNKHRPAAMAHCHNTAATVLDGWMVRIRQLRSFYFQVAALTGDSTATVDDHVSVLSSTDDEEWLWLPWEDHLPISWKVQCLHSGSNVPGAFLVSIIDWICSTERCEGTVRLVNDLELVFAFLTDKTFCFPLSIDGTLNLHMRRPDSMFQRPTIAMLLRPIQAAFTCLSKLFPDVVIRTKPMPAIDAGVYMSFAGVRLALPDQLFSSARSHLLQFTATRAVRKSNDLARPAP